MVKICWQIGVKTDDIFYGCFLTYILQKKWMLDRGDAVQWGHGSFACVNLMLENPQADTL